MKKILAEIWRSFRAHEGEMLAASIAFYVLLSIAPFGVVLLAILGTIFGERTARNELTQRLHSVLRDDVVVLISESVDALAKSEHRGLASIIGSFLFLTAAARMFATLQTILNRIWEIRDQAGLSLFRQGKQYVKQKVQALAMVIATGIIICLFIFLRTFLMLMMHRIANIPTVIHVFEASVSFVALTLMVALMYRYLPNARIAWRDALIGASVTSVLMAIMARLASLYIAQASMISVFGAAGALVAFLLWIYNCAIAFVLGAVMTSAWARLHGRDIIPLKHTVRVLVD